MNTPQARHLAQEIARALAYDESDRAYDLLSPVLSERTPFRFLDIIGDQISAEPAAQVNPYLDRIARDCSEGGWVVIASATWGQYEHSPDRAIARSRAFIAQADVWYGADIFGERVPGPALVADFNHALDLLDPWRTGDNRWVLRSVGVAAHFWAKRSNGAPELATQARGLLDFLAPMFGEWEMDAGKGVAWGLKTIGRHYPDLVADWLVEDILSRDIKYRAHMLRKATMYLNDEQKSRVEALIPGAEIT